MAAGLNASRGRGSKPAKPGDGGLVKELSREYDESLSKGAAVSPRADVFKDRYCQEVRRMNEKELALFNEFGSLLMKDVRDKSIEAMLARIRGKMKDKLSRSQHARLKKLGLTPAGAELIEELVLTAVDETLLDFLVFLDQREISVTYCDDLGDKIDVNKDSDGLDLALWSEDGWIAQFSRFRSPTSDAYGEA